MSEQVSIVGCGWLGLPLAKRLMAESKVVKGSTTHIGKLPHLKAEGIEAFYVELKKDKILGDVQECLSGSDILILNIPPGIRKHPETDFVIQISLLIPFIEKSSIKSVVFISSTSVYNDEPSIPHITENTVPNPESEPGRQILEIEKILQSNSNFRTTVLRFSGLFGDDRHPATYLSGKTDLKNPEAPVNLIHLQDCIGIIHAIIQENCWDETFNASASPHPTRKEYYTSVCNSRNLPIPHFEKNSTNKGKLIDSKKLIEILNYEFQVKLNN